jgi:hypothetical protein
MQRNQRGPLELPAKVVEPLVTAASFGPIIVIRRDSKWLYLCKHVRTTSGAVLAPLPGGDRPI